ncbi:MAG: hypothetical protein HYZ17_11905 [Betaproteobacteria bacterium]|nr:hypothetical protein [Betaproteobacteria bacterium]
MRSGSVAVDAFAFFDAHFHVGFSGVADDSHVPALNGAQQRIARHGDEAALVKGGHAE